jgi:hypothetical protein
MCSFKKCTYTVKMGWQCINRLQCGEALQYVNVYSCFSICVPAQKLMCLFNNTCMARLFLYYCFITIRAQQCGLSMEVCKVCKGVYSTHRFLLNPVHFIKVQFNFHQNKLLYFMCVKIICTLSPPWNSTNI